MKILDCTLRDGGYYNNWDFNEDLVKAYLNAMAKANIDYVELGLRNFPQPKFLGPYAYTTEGFLKELDLPDGPKYGVMIDAKTILQSNLSVEDALNYLFIEKKHSKIELVRIAAHFSEAPDCMVIAKTLKNKGYAVGVNLMQSGGMASNDISNIASTINSWNCVDYLYFADSFGNMDAKEVHRVVNAIRMGWSQTVGIHTHNNMARALDNALEANRLGVEIIDVTVTGMGRGAGNAQTENLLALLNQKTSTYNPIPVFDLTIRHFSKLQKQYGWGSNLVYFVGAQNNIHPTYIQNILSSDRFGPDEIMGAIEYLSKADCSSYNGDILEQALNLNKNKYTKSGSHDVIGIFSNRDVLIVGNGPSIEKYKNGISAYIKNKKPVVLSINVNKSIESSLVDHYVITHNTKFFAEKNLYKDVTKSIIMPRHLFSAEEISVINRTTRIIDYGLDIQNDTFTASKEYCTIPKELTVAYALATAITGNALSVKLVGFDGYDKDDERQQEMIDLFIMVKKTYNKLNIESLTPTTYPVKKGSIYAPHQ